ncbi:type I-G CRISPR-associated helicase/endonuclease Cas3g [Tsukamurella soli]|uniref:HD Cas3-type domain-containing protein n=1 Tax=Tsukamurella soli TaxID=644556 RepID=A0ABP8KFN9_9ACTN
MTGLAVGEFADYFSALHGYQPFAWQRRLCESIAATGEWPEVIDSPTGTGKSNVVDIHVFVNALHGWGACPRVPRRLAIVVNRRGIVDAHEQRAQELQASLSDKTRTDVLDRVAEGLSRLQNCRTDTKAALSLVTLRGGLLPAREWIDDPATCTVMCATPDMWGSRLLFNGYGSSRLARPREAGLLAYDSVMVLDEAHLNQQLLTTARRVRELVRRHPLPGPSLQVVETTATPLASGSSRIAGVDVKDLDDEVLARRLTRPKPVTYHATDQWPKRKASDKYVDEIVDEVVRLWEAVATGTVGCVVNTVSTAVRVSERLKSNKRIAGSETRDGVLTWVGPMRPMDLRAQIDEYPGAFAPAGDARIGVVVATQTIEVGVDVDFAALVTELAPGTSLMQRAGRVNRLGDRESGPIVVIGPTAEATESGAYSAAELTRALDWVRAAAEDPAGLAFAGHSRETAPAADSRRGLLSRLEVGDALALTSTSEILATSPDLTLWIRDDLSGEGRTCGIVLRAGLPVNDVDAIALLRATPPATWETFPTHLHIAQDLCLKLRDLQGPYGRAFVWRDGSLTQMDLGIEEAPRVGDIVMLDDVHPIVAAHTIVEYDHGAEVVDTAWGTKDVEVLWRHSDPLLFEQIDDIRHDSDNAVDDIHELVAAIPRLQDADRSQVTVGPPLDGEDEGRTPWIVLRPRAAVLDDEETRQTWSGREQVTLATHSQAVADRVSILAAHLRMSADQARALELAGLYHDLGKQDRRFQRLLNASDSTDVLAKSGDRSSRRAQLRKAGAGLPAGWRHEQLSVLLAAPQLAGVGREQRELVLRLVGTSHGWGRGGFQHGTRDLVEGGEISDEAADLFDYGGWEALIEATERRHGPWACAYLEALLRAADCSVSKEGS